MCVQIKFEKSTNCFKFRLFTTYVFITEVDVAYVDFKVGDTKGWVRLAKENAAKEFAEKFPDGKVKIGDADVVFKLLEDDEETEYLKRTVEDMVKKRHNQKNFSKQFKHKGGYKGKQSRKRKQDQHGDEPSRKVKADCQLHAILISVAIILRLDYRFFVICR